MTAVLGVGGTKVGRRRRLVYRIRGGRKVRDRGYRGGGGRQIPMRAGNPELVEYLGQSAQFGEVTCASKAWRPSFSRS